ncbi:MAG: hypothetical protein ABI123_04825 [Ginsengibacter sp.]|jgi:hypothetical protein
MKKFLFLIATFAYFTSISGATIYIHECMGNVVDWTFQADENSKCENCGMHKNAANDCCKDEVKVLKVNADHKQFENIAPVFKMSEVLLPITYLFVNRDLLPKIHKENYPLDNFNSPATKDLSILYCNFRI